MIIIDTSVLFYKNVFGIGHEILNKDISVLANNLLKSLAYYSKIFGASRKNPMVLAVDSKKNWRSEFYKENVSKMLGGVSYKSGRNKSSEFDWKAIFEAYNNVLDFLKEGSDFFVMKVDMAEADCIIATLSKFCTKKREECFIVTTDKDMDQLINEYVHVWNITKSGKFVHIDDVKRFKALHIMIGDKVDGIPAIRKRMGIKTAEKTYPELENLLKTDAELRERYEINQKLIDLDFIPEEISNNILLEYKKQSFNFNQIKLIPLMWKYNLIEHLDNIKNFKVSKTKLTTKMNSYFMRNKKEEKVKKSILDSFLDSSDF